MLTILLIIIGIVVFIYINFRWDYRSRKFKVFLGVVFAAFVIWFSISISKEVVDVVHIADYPQVWIGETTHFAGGALTLESLELSEGFTAQRFNVDQNQYEEVEVKADMHGEDMLLLKTTLTNNGSDTLRIVHDDLKFYAKPVEEGNNINGRSAVDGYLYHTDQVELAVGESVPVWFWMSLTEEEEELPFVYVLAYGNTGCVINFQPLVNENPYEGIYPKWGGYMERNLY